MKIILGVDSIRTPLTGIGQYTFQLATLLTSRNQIENIKYFTNGKWQTLEQLKGRLETKPGTAKKISWVRKLAHNSLVSTAYGKTVPHLTSFKVRNLKDYIYHGPNYFIPKTDLTTVVTVHDLSTFKDSSWHPASRIKRINSTLPSTLQRAHIVLTDSNAIRSEVMDYFNLPEDKVIAIPLGVDPIFQPRKSCDLNAVLAKYSLNHGSYALCVATIEPRKNILRLIKAYRRLPHSIKERWPLVLIGESGWNNESTMQEIKQGQNEGWLKYFGYISKDDLPFIYSGCRLFVYPSLYEGFGLPILEAMASDVPVLTSNCSSMPEVTENAACLINPEDEEDLYNNLQQCLQDESWQNNCKQLGLTQASKFNWNNCIDQTIEAYKVALSRT